MDLREVRSPTHGTTMPGRTPWPAGPPRSPCP